MSMTTELPSEQGWYWAVDKKGRWYMTFVDTGSEEVLFWDGESPNHPPARFDFDAPNHKGCKQWYGPFACPGGDLGGTTVILTEEQQRDGERDRKAMVLVHVDYRYCRDEGHGSSITITSVLPREEADKYIRREVDAIADEKRKTEGT